MGLCKSPICHLVVPKYFSMMGNTPPEGKAEYTCPILPILDIFSIKLALRNLNCLPFCVPAGIFTFAFPPSIVGTSIVVPKAASAKELFAQKDIDGGLVGGAALIIEEFVGIIEGAQ